jgi:6-phosphofructokinase 1
MGRDSGYIALNAAVACGAEDVFIPETRSDIEKLRARLLERNHSSRRSSVVIVAEGDELGGAKEIADLIKGEDVPLDIRCTILGHIQRGGRPTMRDRILASRMGAAAVSMLLEGKSNVMTGVVNGEIVATPFSEAIGKRKKLSRDLIVLNDIMTH